MNRGVRAVKGRDARIFCGATTLAIALLTSTFGFHPAGAAGFTKGREIAPLSPEFAPGDYVWKPEVSPAGPVLIIVSIPRQQMLVYRNGVRIGRSTVSTGSKGHATPTGVFTILQKKVDHESSIYKGSKMPYMQRLTWDGIAIHAGQLPGYPASHGCVRLPVEFAAKLFQVTSNGTTVVVTDKTHAPGRTANPGLLLSGKTGATSVGPLPASGFEWQPAAAKTGALALIFSLGESEVFVYRNGVQIGRGKFGLGRGVNISGTHVYSALGRVDGKDLRDWLAVTSIGGGTRPEGGCRACNLPTGVCEEGPSPDYSRHDLDPDRFVGFSQSRPPLTLWVISGRLNSSALRT